MKTNRRNARRQKVRLVGGHTAGLALTAITVAVVCYIFDAQCTMYGNKIKESEKQIAQLNGELKQEEYRWGLACRPEELDRVARHHGIYMEPAPSVEQIVNIDKNKTTLEGRPAWAVRFHPEVAKVVQRGASPFEYVKNLRKNKR